MEGALIQPDPFHGVGGAYEMDPETGMRKLIFRTGMNDTQTEEAENG